MGLEAVCTARFQGRAAEGKALLETDTLFSRGEMRLAIPLKAVTGINVENGDLEVAFPDGTAVFEIGDKAEKWADTMLNQKRRADKLSIKAGMRIAVIDLDDADFLAELKSREAVLNHEEEDLDAIFFGAASKHRLDELRWLSERIKPAWAIWVVSPRGDPSITERDVMDGARAANLVDIKVVRFSETLTSAKLVIPVAFRKKARA
jgi:hypothetical protein